MGAWSAGRVVRARRLLIEELARTTEALRESREAHARDAVAAERAHIARELHDVIAHSVGVMVVKAGAAERMIPLAPDRAADHMILEAEPDLTVVGEAVDGVEATRLTAELAPDVVLMDVRMPRMDGIEATRRITAAGRARVLVLTTFDLDEHVWDAVVAGASGFLLKDVRPRDLGHAVRTVAAGDSLVAPAVTRRLLAEFTLARPRDGGLNAWPG